MVMCCHLRGGKTGSGCLMSSRGFSLYPEFAEADKAVLDGMAVKGRLRHHIHLWVEELHATQWIIDMI